MVSLLGGVGLLGSVLYLFWVEVFFVAGHVLCQTEDFHLFADGCLDDFLEGVFCMAWAELARVAVVREGHLMCSGQRM